MSIRVAIVGVGNCATALMEGIIYYRGAPGDTDGLARPILGGFAVGDIEPVVAFDVDELKVGRTLGEAAQSNDRRFDWEIGFGGVVHRGAELDGIGASSSVRLAKQSPVDVAEILRQYEVEIVVNYLPVGSTEATHHYVDAALAAGCGFVNAVPVPVACSPEIALRFLDAQLPVIGDDVKSQYGATILHRALARIALERGVSIENTYQLNVGGNADFRNMLDSERLVDKRRSKTGSVTDVYDMPADRVHIGPSDYIGHLADSKVAYINLEMRGFSGSNISVECKLKVDDSPNSAGVVVDAIRYARIALDHGEGGALEAPSAALMKSPPTHDEDDRAALRACDQWLQNMLA